MAHWDADTMTANSLTPLPGIKVYCEHPLWSRKLQILLRDTIGARWGFNGIEIPWNTGRPYLVVEQGRDGAWIISWATQADFDACPLPNYTARGLVFAWRALPKAQRRLQCTLEQP
jgi:hypothetical protein